MRLQVQLPDAGVEAEATLYSERAPELCRAIFDSVATPLETRTSHACFDGHEVFCFLPAFPEVPELCNRTMRPEPGELMFFHAERNDFAFLGEEDRMTPAAGPMHELAFIYGVVDLRHFWEEGLQGSLVGKITQGLDEFAEAAIRTLDSGATSLRIGQA